MNVVHRSHVNRLTEVFDTLPVPEAHSLDVEVPPNERGHLVPLTQESNHVKGG
jgi:hypothetical protein